jgi:transposase InsO family protein
METARKKTRRKFKDPLYGRGKGGSNYKKRYPSELKLKCVKLYLEEGYSSSFIEEEIGIEKNNVHRWVNIYKEKGELGLRPPSYRRRKRNLDPSVRKKIVELKKRDSKHGVRRISHILRRVFFLQASPETVRKTLHEENLIEKPKKKRKRNIAKPRFFERSTPNQMWQSDIFMFRLGGKYAYLIGYIDDYSRYITGMCLFRSQTAEHVIEVYRTAAAEYNPPKEMLTDNGRQYTNWRGTSRFEAELNKDRVKHIRSQPHHPMTLGKIERFWKTIFGEFLGRAQFNNFEEARERVGKWITYYNHKRPHQGIGGLCPADRYFEVASAIKRTIQEGIEENILETALRGKPTSPFYMVGRMQGQSVVLKAEKGRIKLSVDDNDKKNRELTYNLNQGENNGTETEETNDAEITPERTDMPVNEILRNGEGAGGAVDMDREQETVGGMQGASDKVCDTELLAEQGHRGDAAGVGTQSEPGEGASSVSPSPEVPGQAGDGTEESHVELNQTGRETSKNPEFQACKECIFRQKVINERRVIADAEEERPGGGITKTGGDNNEGPVRGDDCHRGSPPAGDLQEDILQVGEEGPGGDDECLGGVAPWPSGAGKGPGDGGHAEEDPETGAGTGDCKEVGDGEETLPCLGNTEGQGQE